MRPEDLKKFIMVLLSDLVKITKSSFFGSSLRDEFMRYYEHVAFQRGLSRHTAEQYFHKIVYCAACINKAKEHELPPTSTQILIVADFLNRNPLFKEQVLPGVADQVTGEDLISYYNMRAMPAILGEWLPAKAKYHKLSPIKDESVSWSEVNGILVLRQKQDCILMRGDTRNPEEVLSSHGFTPTVPRAAFADRRNEGILRELAHHFPARISFSCEHSIAARYMRNAANRQQKQYSYIYHVNVKNMQTVDIRLNLKEGRLGRFLTRQYIEKFIENWVDEQVVLGSFIPVENIAKVEKFEVVTMDPSSSIPSVRNGFKICGVYYYNAQNRNFDYEDVEYRDPAFKYKSACIISCTGLRVHDDPSKETELYSIDTVDWPTFRSSYESPYKTSHFTKLQTPRDSLPSNQLALISLNYSFQDDAKESFQFTKRKLRKCFEKITSPAKIYIFAEKGEDNESIIQLSQQCFDHNPAEFRLSLKLFAQLLKETLPVSRGINFHLLIHDGFMLAAPFMHELLAVGFRNCFIVSYVGGVSVLASYEKQSYHTIDIYDFGSKSRVDHDRKKVIHHADKPNLSDNKIITFWANGKVSQSGYREWIKANPEKYSAEYRKDLWIQNMTAVLTEVIDWLRKEIELTSESQGLNFSLKCLVSTAHEYLHNSEGNNFFHQKFAAFLIALFRSLDLITSMPKYSIAAPILNEVVAKATASGEEQTKYEAHDFCKSFEALKKNLLPIIPIEFEEVKYDINNPEIPKDLKTFPITQVMPASVLITRMELSEVPDFRPIA